jgi:hypothetical protein
VFLTHLLKLNLHNLFHVFLLVSLVNPMKKLKHFRVPYLKMNIYIFEFNKIKKFTIISSNNEISINKTIG